MVFSFVTLYKAPLNKEFCTGVLALCTRLLSEEVQNFGSYRTKLYNACFTLLEKMKTAATAPSCFSSEVLMTQVPVSGFNETVRVQKSNAAATQTFRRSKKDNEKVTQTRLRHPCAELSTALGASSSEHTSQSTPSATSASLPPSYSPPSGSTSLRCFARLRPQVPVPVLQLSCDNYVEAQDFSRMTMSKSGDKSD